MKVLFIGGTGVISQAVTKLLNEKGIDLYLLNRGNSIELIPEGVNLIKCDIRDKKKVKEAVKGYYFDCVVNWVAYVVNHVKDDIEMFKDITSQYIFISSASAYQKPAVDYVITESTALVNPFWQYSRDKIECEDYLINEHRKNGFPVSIVRPSHTYSNRCIPVAFNSSKHRWSIADRIIKGKKIIAHGDGTSLWVLTHNSDFAVGFAGLVGNPKTIGHAFHITSDEVLSWNQIHKFLGNALGIEPNVINIPSDFIESFMESKGNLSGDKSTSVVFDNSKIKKFVPEFKAVKPFHIGINESINWYKEDKSRCTIDKNWNELLDKIISSYERALK